MKLIRHWIALFLGACLVIFALQNITLVEVQFLFWSFHAYRFVILAVSFLIGCVMGWLLKAHGANRRRRKTVTTPAAND